MSNFVSIDRTLLASVSGGDGTQQQTNGTVQVQTPTVSGSFSGSQSSSTSQSERNQCLQNNQRALCPVNFFTRETSDPDACARRLNEVCNKPTGQQNSTGAGTTSAEQLRARVE